MKFLRLKVRIQKTNLRFVALGLCVLGVLKMVAVSVMVERLSWCVGRMSWCVEKLS